MVKVISAYNFEEQNTYSVAGDIVGTCCIGTTRLAIAHRNHLIEILFLKRRINKGANGQFDQNENKTPLKIAFPTVDQVTQIHYSSTGNFLLTLEQKAECNDPIQQRYVRIYTNFDIAVSDKYFLTPIRARIASKVTPKSISSDCIEVIELPLNFNPDLITCCNMSGTVAVSSNNSIYFYEFRKRKNDIQKFTFIDFFEIPFYIKLDFKPNKIYIAEHVLACLNESILVSFKIVDLADINTEDGSTSNSMTTDSSMNVFRGTKNDIIDYEVAKQCNQVNGSILESEIISNWDSNIETKRTLSEERPSIINDIKISLKPIDNAMTNDQTFYSVRSLLQLRLPKNNINNLIHDQFRCMAMKAIYQKTNDRIQMIEKTSYVHPMKSQYHGNCVGFSLFISTVSDGYLYQFTNQGKWYTENTKCLAIYPFTAPVVDVIIDNFVIHAITECGIETFSSRIGHKLFSNYFEYPMMSDIFPNETSPLVELPICVMGICGFFGIRYVNASNTNLILLTTDIDSSIYQNKSNKKIDKCETDWTIYDLHLAKPEILACDIQNLAKTYNNTSPDIFFELMEEAHIIVRLSRKLLLDYDDQTRKKLEDLYIVTCQELADFTVQSERKDIYSQAVAYYTMCNQTIWDVYKRYQTQIIPSKNKDIRINYDGLLYTIKLMISRNGTYKSDNDYLSQNIKPLLKNVMNISYDYTLAEELFNLYIIHAPDEIASIALNSIAFCQILNVQLIKYYMNKKPLKNDELLCLILCLCNNSQCDEAIEYLEIFSRKNLYQTLKSHWIILFDNFCMDNYRRASFSDLTETVLLVSQKPNTINAIADTIIYILIIKHYIDLDFILKLFMNFFAVYLGQKRCRTSHLILEIILQSYFYDYYTLNNRNNVKLSNFSIQNSELLLTQSNSSLLYNLNNDDNTKNINITNDNSKTNNSYINSESSTSTTIDSNYDDPELEAMKILFRMYLGFLKQYTSLEKIENNIINELPDIIDYRLAYIDYMLRNSKIIKNIHTKFDQCNSYSVNNNYFLPNYDLINNDNDINTFRRPFVFFEKRELFLNNMYPLDDESFKKDFDDVLYFDDWDNDINVIIVKLQALLNSGKLNKSIIDDFIAFIQANPNLIGIDTLISILLPKLEGVEFLIHVNPQNLLNYGRSRLTTPCQWQILFRRILAKRRDLMDKMKFTLIKIYDRVIDEILHALVAEKTLEDFLACLPEQEVQITKENSYQKLLAMDDIDPMNPFQVIMREAVAKQRSDALCAMIKSTGQQLFDAVNARL